MKTIAISIDSPTLEHLDRLARSRAERSPGRREAGRGRRPSRSELVRLALREFIARQEKEQREIRERSVLRRNRRLLARQAKALVAEQAKL